MIFRVQEEVPPYSGASQPALAFSPDFSSEPFPTFFSFDACSRYPATT